MYILLKNLGPKQKHPIFNLDRWSKSEFDLTIAILSPSSGLKIGTASFFETLASTDESTRRQNPEEQHHKLHHPHRRENLKSQRFTVSLRAQKIFTYFVFLSPGFNLEFVRN
jgi:hypothetical protein